MQQLLNYWNIYQADNHITTGVHGDLPAVDE